MHSQQQILTCVLSGALESGADAGCMAGAVSSTRHLLAAFSSFVSYLLIDFTASPPMNSAIACKKAKCLLYR